MHMHVCNNIYLCSQPGEARAPLRELLYRNLGARIWAEITCGRSYAGYKALDLYLQVNTYPSHEEPQEAQYLLNVGMPVHQRPSIGPEQWYLCPQWVSAGQKYGINQWYLSQKSRL